MNIRTIIENKLVEMIDTSRKEFDKLTEEEKKHFNAFDSLNKPCQFHVLACEEYQLYLIIKTNLAELDDKLIDVVELPSEGYEEKLEKFLDQPYWKKKRTSDYDDMFIMMDGYEMVRSILLEFAQNLRQKNYDKITKITGFTGSIIAPYWYLACNIEEVDLNQKAIQTIENYKRNVSSARQKLEPLPTIPNIQKSAFAAYFHPFVIIGEYEKTLRGQLSGTDYMQLGDIVFDTIFDGIRLAITKGGLVAVDIDDPVRANKIVNTIFGTALLFGFKFYPNRIPELGSAILKDKIFVNSWQTLSLRTMMYDQRSIYSRHEIFLMRIRIEQSDLEQIVETARIIWEKGHSDIVRLLLESYYFFEHREFLQSFNASWLIIEKYLRTTWMNQLKSFRSETKEDLRRIDLYTILKILKNEGLLTGQKHSNMGKLREVRNKVFHGEEPNEEATRMCLEQALQIVRSETEIEKKVEFEKLNSIML